MIAAQALVHRATLVTFNQDDFSDVPGIGTACVVLGLKYAATSHLAHCAHHDVHNNQIQLKAVSLIGIVKPKLAL
jgi:hypothetical protein